MADTSSSGGEPVVVLDDDGRGSGGRGVTLVVVDDDGPVDVREEVAMGSDEGVVFRTVGARPPDPLAAAASVEATGAAVTNMWWKQALVPWSGWNDGASPVAPRACQAVTPPVAEAEAAGRCVGAGSDPGQGRAGQPEPPATSARAPIVAIVNDRWPMLSTFGNWVMEDGEQVWLNAEGTAWVKEGGVVVARIPDAQESQPSASPSSLRESEVVRKLSFNAFDDEEEWGDEEKEEEMEAGADGHEGNGEAATHDGGEKRRRLS